MPRYFFDTYDGDLFLPDDQGIELEDLAAVKAEASRGLADTFALNRPRSHSITLGARDRS